MASSPSDLSLPPLTINNKNHIDPLTARLRYNTLSDLTTYQWSIPIAPLPPPILGETQFDLDLALQHAWIGSLLPANWVLYILSLASEIFVEEPNLLQIMIEDHILLPTKVDSNQNRAELSPPTRLSIGSEAMPRFTEHQTSHTIASSNPEGTNPTGNNNLNTNPDPANPPSLRLNDATVPTQCSAQNQLPEDNAPNNNNNPAHNTLANICIVGDLHGQFFDLLEIFRRNDVPPFRRYLFLGDFVDRGACSLETIVLLLLLKIKYPLFIYMLRGNHESSLSTVYGFKHEIMSKYPIKVSPAPKLTRSLVKQLHNTPLLGKPIDPELGKPHCVFTEAICTAPPFPNTTIYSQFLYLFMTLPIAALVNTKSRADPTRVLPHCLCVHGGLSPRIRFLKSFEKIFRFVEVEDNSSSPVVDLLWSDPTLDFNSYHKNNRGCGYVFGKSIWDTFIHDNSLDTIIRSHELKPYGLQIYDDKVITVWSAPNYLRHYRNKACVMILRSPTYDVVHQQLAENQQLLPQDDAAPPINSYNEPLLNVGNGDDVLGDSSPSTRPIQLSFEINYLPPIVSTNGLNLSSLGQHQFEHEQLRKQRQFEQFQQGKYRPLYTAIPPHPYYIFAQNDGDVANAVYQQYQSQAKPSCKSDSVSTCNDQPETPKGNSPQTTTMTTHSRRPSTLSTNSLGSSHFEDSDGVPAKVHQPAAPTPKKKSIPSAPNRVQSPEQHADQIRSSDQVMVTTPDTPKMGNIISSPVTDSTNLDQQNNHNDPSTFSTQPTHLKTKLLYHIVDIEPFPDHYSNEILSMTNNLKHLSFSSIYGDAYTSTIQPPLSMFSISQAYFGTPISIDSPSITPVSSHRQRRPSSPVGSASPQVSSQDSEEADVPLFSLAAGPSLRSKQEL